MMQGLTSVERLSVLLVTEPTDSVSIDLLWSMNLYESIINIAWPPGLNHAQNTAQAKQIISLADMLFLFADDDKSSYLFLAANNAGIVTLDSRPQETD